jgi:hypothetical protein
MPDGSGEVDVGGFAAVINSRLGAEARVAKAISFGWFCGGLAIALCLTGMGCASAFYGYSYMLSVKPAAEEVAKALVDAMQRSELKTTVTGTMSLAADSEVVLAPGQIVKLNEGATVKLDPNSTIRVVGDLKIDIPQPSKQQLQIDTMSKSSDELPFTNYTIFTDVRFGTGEVVTGWNYDLSDTLRPKQQYCYYGENLDKGLNARYTLALNGTPQRPSALAKLSFNFDGALANCIWFSGL